LSATLVPEPASSPIRTAAATPLRVGLIGCGKMGLHHLKAIALSGVSTVVGVADPAATADDLGAALPAGARVFAQARDMLAETRPDVVHIVTPPETHAPLALMAIEAGCHVYVEKPFTFTAADAERILDAARRRGLKVCAGHQVLFEPPALAVRESLKSIGRLVHVESYFSFKMVRRTITAVEQAKDILPHAVYPVAEQLRIGTGLSSPPIEVTGISVSAEGNAYALLRLGDATGIVVVTLTGRPVEQYQSIVGTNGSLRPDYIGGGMAALLGPGTGPGVLLTPYRRAFRTLGGTTRGIVRLLRGGSYPGLRELVRRFHVSIEGGTEPPISPGAILDTVAICERIGHELDRVHAEFEDAARQRLLAEERLLPPLADSFSRVLLTGGTGLLGTQVARELRQSGFAVRVLARKLPPHSRRVPGVDYVAVDLARGVDPATLQGVGLVVHAAAETAGGRAEHQRNSLDATRNLVTAAAAAGIKAFLQISSLAVLQTSRQVERPLAESTPVDTGNLGRGPYVWGKAESEVLAQRLGAELGMNVKVIRPGPLVDYSAFQPPGRLGREIGPLFVAVGPKRAALSVCDVSMAAGVIRWYATNFDQAPSVLNLVDAPAPARQELLNRFLKNRSDLTSFWLPFAALRLLSAPLRLLQRVALGAQVPVDVAAAFASEQYQTDLAARVIAQAHSERYHR
jgi:predicted dehydrogenase/nucleoside-diphosphate-sugar epimerase